MSTGTILLIALFVAGPLLMMFSHRGHGGGGGSMMGGCGPGGHAGHRGAHDSSPEDESEPPAGQGEPGQYGSDESGRYGSDADADLRDQRQPDHASHH